MESQLPNDIILLILSKLPVKSLLQFRCVCKHWCASISDPQFTLSIQRRRVLVESTSVRQIIEEMVLDSIDDERASIETLLRKPWEEKHDEVHVLGSCNGLLLISRGTDIFLWNPSIRVCKKVLTYENFSFLQYYDVYLMSGFCYDSTTDDYKAVIVSPPLDYGHYLVHFSSLKNECWKEIEFPYMIEPQYWRPVVNGHFHWVVDDYSVSNSLVIINFDQILNKFRELPIPEKIINRNLFVGLGELDGCLAISRGDINCRGSGTERFGSIIEVWAMKDYGVEESWTYLFKISYFGEMRAFYYELEPLLYTKDGQVTMRVCREEIVVYDPQQETYRRINRGPRDSFQITAVATYLETLISPLDVIKTKGGKYVEKRENLSEALELRETLV